MTDSHRLHLLILVQEGLCGLELLENDILMLLAPWNKLDLEWLRAVTDALVIRVDVNLNGFPSRGIDLPLNIKCPEKLCGDPPLGPFSQMHAGADASTSSVAKVM
jgi:hypothetical protein